MRILLSNHQLTVRSGSELATCELARGLAARGHDVAVFTFFKGALAEELTREHGIPVFDDTQVHQIVLFGAEIVHTHHTPCAHFLRLYTMGAVRIHGMLGVLTPLEAPPLDADVFSLGLAISEEVAERIAFTPFNAVPIEIFRNWFDEPSAASLAPPDLARPIKVAVVSNHVAPELATALTELRAAGEIVPEYFGLEGVSAVINSKLLSRYAIVVSIGRTALMATACGRPCIMADVHGSDGLLTAENIDHAMRSNFSGRATGTPITAAHLATEIERARTVDLSGLRERVLREFSIEQRLDFLERRYAELLASPANRRADRGDWPAEGSAYAELAARVRHAEHLLAVERTAKSSAIDALAAEIDTLAHLFDEQSDQLDHLQNEVARYRSVAESHVGSSKQDAHIIDHLQRTLASRDEAIAWLQAELAFARRKETVSSPPRRGIRSVLRSALGELAKRSPLLRKAVRGAIPLPLRERLHKLLSGGDAPPQSPSMEAMAAAIVDEHGFDALPGRFDVICYANIEWAARFQRPQQMMLQFARGGHRVFYVVASRKPLDGAPYSIEQVAENVVQVALKVDALPDHYAEAMSPDVHASYASSLAAIAHDFRIYAPVQIVHLPFWTPLARDFRKTRKWRVAYDCMDEWDSFPRIGAPLLAAEHALVRDSDLVTVTSQLLLEKWQVEAPNALLVRNGVDNAFFAERLAANALLAAISHPIIGYYGALAEWVDFQLVADLADAAPEWSFVLIGDHFTAEVDLLKGKPNVHLLGLRPYADMPRYLFNFNACIIPFKLNKITHAVDPVKFYEFLSGGKPIVSTPLEELQPFGSYVSFAETADGFKRALADHLENDTPENVQERQAFAMQNDWRQRFESYSNALTALYPMVSIVVVTYGNLDLTRLCLGSVLRDTEHPRYEVIIVDNASTDGTPDYLRALAGDHENVRIVLNDTNRGFAAANNQGLAIASGDVLILLNNDTVVPRGWLSGLLSHLEDAEIGLLGPVTNAVGNEAKVSPDYADITGLQPYADNRRNALSGRHFDIRMLAMFCLAMRRDVFERLGPLDENYGVGMFEDDDYSMRAKAAGYRVVCAEDVYIHHFGQAAFKKLIESGEYEALWQRNQAYFESKWGSWRPHVHRTPA
jgi:GT2 family glycosyltransferase